MEPVQKLFEDAKLASDEMRGLDDKLKQEILRSLSTKILQNSKQIIVENAKDLEKMQDTDPKKDRLLLSADRITALAQSLNEIAALPDPSNTILSEVHTANGLFIQKKSVPLGVVGVIYESRPNVTIDVAALCLRSGNACILRGGSDAFYTNTCLVHLIRSVLDEHQVDINAVQLFPSDRKLIVDMLEATRFIDIIIPRGSQELIDYVRKNSLVPVIETGAGVCHTYVESSANLSDAVNIVVNAKVSRPSVCNALDTVIIDRQIVREFLTMLAPAMKEYHVEIFADLESHQILTELKYPFLSKARPDDFGREFLDFKCSIKVVDNDKEALSHISRFSSRHSEAIVSQDAVVSENFLNKVDSAAVYLNASTRFTDGAAFGLGAEIGISTQKLHARGPFALEKLVTEKWVVKGAGQIR